MMILPIVLALAQIAASADHLNSGPEGFIVNNPALPTEYANSPLPCASGLKLQRYHEARPGNMGPMSARIPEDYGDPAGWADVDATKPHDGDYRCVRGPAGQAEGDLGNKTDYVITHEPYDGLGTPFPASPSLNQTWHGFRWDGQAWKFIPVETGMRDCPADQHLHPAAMSTFMPDTQGGPLPKADGLCHRNDNTDAPVLSHGRKLEAKR